MLTRLDSNTTGTNPSSVTDATSPWPERTRTQLLLFAAGVAFLLPGVLSFVDLVEFGGTAIVGSTAVASALLIYGLLGWGGNWVEEDDSESEEPAG